LNLGNIRFYDNNNRPLNIRKTSLHQAEYVSVTFVMQKVQPKNETRTQQRTGDPVLCPVLSWGALITRLLSYPASSDSTPVNFFFDSSRPVHDRFRFISQAATNTLLRHTCKIKPDLYFGYQADSIGSHSLRSGAAMALFLAGEPTSKIMILGRWSSDAFMMYIRPNVQQWTSGMSKDMIRTNDYHISAHSTTISSNRTTATRSSNNSS
jgi:hypothetical protein